VRGSRLPPAFWHSRYVIRDFLLFGLLPPPEGYEWVRYGPDVLLVSTTDGWVQDGVYGAFAESDQAPDPDYSAPPDQGGYDQGPESFSVSTVGGGGQPAVSQFVNEGDQGWTEYQNGEPVFHFREMMRDGDALYLYDDSRGLWVGLQMEDGGVAEGYFAFGPADQPPPPDQFSPLNPNAG